MPEPVKQPRKLSRAKLATIIAAAFLVIVALVVSVAFLLPKPDYVKLCLEDQANGRVTETSAGPNCDKAAEAERLKSCGGTVEACRETLEN